MLNYHIYEYLWTINLHWVVSALCGVCTVWSGHCVVSALCGVCTVLCVHCVVSALCGVCTVLCVRWVVYKLCGVCTVLCIRCVVYIRVDQIFRLSCLRLHVLGWVKKRVRRNMNFFKVRRRVAQVCQSFQECLIGPQIFFVRNRWCLVSKDSYFDADSNKIDIAQSKNAPNQSKIEKTWFLVKNLAEYKSHHLFKFYSFQVHFKRKCQEW